MSGRKSLRKQPLTCLLDFDDMDDGNEDQGNFSIKMNPKAGKENKTKTASNSKKKILKEETSSNSKKEILEEEAESDSDDDLFQNLKRTGIKIKRDRPSTKLTETPPRATLPEVRKELFPSSPKLKAQEKNPRKRQSLLENEYVPPMKLVRSHSSSYTISPVTKPQTSEKKHVENSSPVRVQLKKEVRTPPSKKHGKPSCGTPTTPLGMARIALHNAAVPKSLPCRESEFQNILSFVENKVADQVGGCMYISGVPGTGKTATVTQVIKKLQSASLAGQLPKFLYIEINGMRLTDPKQAYVQIYQQIFQKNERVSADVAFKKLDRYFNAADSKKKTTVLLVDELDLMCTRKQEVVYNLLDWPSRPSARLVVLTIANTMDMPERKLKGRVTSRLGLTRLTFLPYTHKQLEEIVLTRLQGNDAFLLDAVRLATRKVAAVSGDARRALDICRRAAELPEHPDDPVKISHIEQAIKEMTNSNIVKLIRSCSDMERMFLRAMMEVATRTGIDEVDLIQVLEHLQSMCVLEGILQPTVPLILTSCFRLKSSRLVFTNDSRAGLQQRLTHNFSHDDLHYALLSNH